jgi:hypothetical protein
MREMVKAGRPARKRLEFLKLTRFRFLFWRRMPATEYQFQNNRTDPAMNTIPVLSKIGGVPTIEGVPVYPIFGATTGIHSAADVVSAQTLMRTVHAAIG